MSDIEKLFGRVDFLAGRVIALESRLEALEVWQPTEILDRLEALEGLSRRVESIDDVQRFLIRKVAKIEPITDEDFTQEQAFPSPPPTEEEGDPHCPECERPLIKNGRWWDCRDCQTCWHEKEPPTPKPKGGKEGGGE
jgi:hypothetical protein